MGANHASREAVAQPPPSAGNNGDIVGGQADLFVKLTKKGFLRCFVCLDAPWGNCHAFCPTRRAQSSCPRALAIIMPTLGRKPSASITDITLINYQLHPFFHNGDSTINTFVIPLGLEAENPGEKRRWMGKPDGFCHTRAAAPDAVQAARYAWRDDRCH